MPLSCTQTLLSFASAHNSDAGAQAKVLLLHGLAIKIFGCVYSCLAVKMHDHPHRDCHQTVTLIQTQAGWCLCEQLPAALCASSICLSSQCLLVAADHCNLANKYTYSADGGSCHEASPPSTGILLLWFRTTLVGSTTCCLCRFSEAKLVWFKKFKLPHG